MAKKITILVLIAAAAGAFFLFNLGQYLTLDYLKQSQARFQQMYQNNQPGVSAAYMLVYILVTSLSLPGAAVMTLAGGGFFGVLVGTVVVSFASTIGATFACLAARFVLRDWVQQKFGERLTAVNKGIEEEGAFYLFSLRLIPVFPFFVINLLMGLTNMPIRTYFWVSQLGMLPATIVYVNAGGQLARIDSLANIASPALIASFAVLGLFPIIVKKLMSFYKTRYRAEPGKTNG